MKENNYRTPLNYLGNKSRMAKYVLFEIPKGLINIVEPFSGSAVISLNSEIQNVFLNDSNEWTMKLLKYFKDNKSETIIKNSINIIKKYELSCYKNLSKDFKELKNEGYSLLNKNGFNELKRDFNFEQDIEKLFVLLIYGFNHYLRFNSKGEFNTPVGKTHYYKNMDFLIEDYCNKIQSKKIKFSIDSYLKIDLTKFDVNNTLFYIDPPYLITSAPYNDSWNENDEVELYEWVEKLDNLGFKFIISNVIEANGKSNNYLNNVIKKLSLNVIEVERRYLNSNYRKIKKHSKEVLVKNH